MHTGRSSSGLGQSQAPGYTPLSSGTLGENTRQPTHNKLTTEPAKDPLKKDICKPYLATSVSPPTGTTPFVTTPIDTTPTYTTLTDTIPTNCLHDSLGIANI